MGCACTLPSAVRNAPKLPVFAKGLLKENSSDHTEAEDNLVAAARRRDPEPVPIIQNKVTVSGRYHLPPRKIEEVYDIDETAVLGTGYSGSVVTATCRRNGQAYALKCLRLSGLRADCISRLKSEAEIFLSLDHPHIARLVDVFEVGPPCPRLDLVMERMEGGELLDRVQLLQRFSEGGAAHAIFQMLLAVNYIHSRHVVHRDLKLENFLYTRPEEYDLKLIDFGFSHVWDPNTTMGTSVGTLAYSAPEVLSGSYTSKCDMWSLGVITFILLAGYMPFNGSRTQQVAAILQGKYLDKSSRWRRVSDVAKDFMKNLLVVNPDNRLSAIQALDHPFIAGRPAALDSVSRRAPVDTAQVVDALRSFSQASRFRRACMSVMAWSLSDEERALVHDAFLEIDKNRTGVISMFELKLALTKYFDCSDGLLKTYFDALDCDATEEIHYSEFLAAMVSTRIAMHEDLLRSTFERFDVDQSGYITVDNLRDVLGDSFAGECVDQLIKEADFTHDGQVSYKEFLRYLQGPEADSSCAIAANKAIDRSKCQNPPVDSIQSAGGDGNEARRCLNPPGAGSLSRKLTPHSCTSITFNDGTKKDLQQRLSPRGSKTRGTVGMSWCRWRWLPCGGVN